MQSYVFLCASAEAARPCFVALNAVCIIAALAWLTRLSGRRTTDAVFPVALPDFLMRAYADEGDVVLEPFAGAGTTIIAGQRTGRPFPATFGAVCRAPKRTPPRSSRTAAGHR